MPDRRPSRRTRIRQHTGVTANDHISAHLHAYVPEALRGTDRFLDIINWNIRWFNPRDAARLKRITEVFQELNADILVCQEIEAGALDAAAAPPHPRRSPARLAQWLKNELGDEPDVILLGDWNAKPTEPEWQALRAAEASGSLRFLAWNKEGEASHFFQNGAGSRLDLVLVSDDAEKVAVDKGAHVIPWNEAFASIAKLREYIQTLSDHMPVVSRFRSE